MMLLNISLLAPAITNVDARFAVAEAFLTADRSLGKDQSHGQKVRRRQKLGSRDPGETSSFHKCLPVF